LVLDNLETLWEPANARADIEEFLSLLTDIKHLALIVSVMVIISLAGLIAKSQGYNARGRTARKSTMDSALFVSFEAVGTRCSS
jgi:hypothetical protein